MYFGSVDGMLPQKVETCEILMVDLLVYLMGCKDRLEEIRKRGEKDNRKNKYFNVVTNTKLKNIIFKVKFR